MNKKEMEEKLDALERELEAYRRATAMPVPQKSEYNEVLRVLMTDKENTKQVLRSLTEQVKMLREAVSTTMLTAGPADEYAQEPGREVAISAVDASIVEFLQTRPKSMASADDVRDFMHYRGKNAACARLNNLYKRGVLERLQLGHKVYYKFDAGKATIQLIVSPPQ